jgi:hypothetical protein
MVAETPEVSRRPCGYREQDLVDDYQALSSRDASRVRNSFGPVLGRLAP